jgi:hypothetical protein
MCGGRAGAAAAATGLRLRQPLEEHVVLQVDVLHQVLAQRVQASQQRTPGVAGTARLRQPVGQLDHARQRAAVFVVLVAHHRHRRQVHRRQAVAQHGEQHLLLLLHVAFQLLQHAFQVVGQAVRAFGPIGMHRFHAPCQADELRQLLAVALVVAREEVVDEFVGGGLAPVALLRLRVVLHRGQLARQALGIQAQRRGRIAQRLLAATAEVELMPVEHRSGTGDAAGEIAEGTVKQGGCWGHEGLHGRAVDATGKASRRPAVASPHGGGLPKSR